MFNPLEVSWYDAWLERQAEATIFHSSAWAKVLVGTYGHTPRYIAWGQGAGHCDGVLPLMEVRSALTGNRGVSLPFTDVCPALGARQEELESKGLDLARSARWRYVEFRSGEVRAMDAAAGGNGNAIVETGPGWDDAAVTFWGHEVVLSGRDAAALFEALSPSVRRAVRKAESSGVRIHISQDEADMAQYYKLHCITRRRHGLPPQPYRFFQSIARWVVNSGKGFVVLGRLGQETVAGAVFMLFGRSAVYKFGASLPEAQPVRANNLVMWAGLKACAERGCERAHLGRTSRANAGLRQYKRGFGSVETLMSYRRYDLRRDAYVRTPDGAEASWVNHVFRALPPSWLRLAGQILYPHMS